MGKVERVGVVGAGTMGAGIAESGDLGYSYGLSASAPAASADAAYVHLWCRQAPGWRLAVQLRSNFPPG